VGECEQRDLLVTISSCTARQFAVTTAIIEAHGGKSLGSVRYPFPGTTDFASYLLQAQASGADVVAFANAGADASNAIKQAGEFGIASGKVKLAALLCFIPQIKALGLDAAQGLMLTEGFYWDLTTAPAASPLAMRRR
jgi:branched-chain amino acid transport system substrate-binding protein